MSTPCILAFFSSRFHSVSRTVLRSRWVKAVASGVCLAAAFPPLEWSWMAWIAWIPLFGALRESRGRDAIRNGFLAGAVFWSLSLFWMTRVTVAGWAGLSLYCALFAIPFSYFVSRWTCRYGTQSTAANIGLAFGGAVVWTGFEYLRAILFTGFPWNAAGVSQYKNIALLQMASFGGVFAVSWILLAVNLLLAAAGYVAVHSVRKRFPLELSAATGLVVASMGCGSLLLRTIPPSDSSVRLGLIQPAISQYEKWTPEFVSQNHEILRRLSETAIREGAPDLVVWPETAVTESLRADEEAYHLVRAVTDLGPPLLLGVVGQELSSAGKPLYFNRSMLLGPQATLLQTYDKQHLVVYGEYVPWGDRFPYLRSLTPFEYDITPGTESVIFHLNSRDLRFSVLICFEDVISDLSRRAVRKGARLLVNQTNDAWFDGSSASRQHIAQAVFRCVENRVPMARCGNSGWTGWIDAAGRIGGGTSDPLPIVSSEGGVVRDYAIVDIPFRKEVERLPLQALDGEVFGVGTAILGVGLCAGLHSRQRRKPCP